MNEKQCCKEMMEEKGKGYHFFKFILPSCIEDRRLAIPRKFIRIYGKELSNIAVLKVPSNREWHVELREDEGRVWFQNGWHEFMKNHSISNWHILVFKYGGKSRFNVVIFDRTASEICYPMSCMDDLEESIIEIESQITQENHEEEFMEVLNRFSFMKVTNEHESSDGSFQEKERAIKEARAFTSQNPFFSVRMQPSHSLPYAFAKKYVTNDARVVTLRVPDGRTWQVHCSGRYQIRLSKGWKAFVLDNSLKVNDICNFELVDRKHMELKVSISRAYQAPTQRKTQPQSPGSNPIYRVKNEEKQNGYAGKRKLTDLEENDVLQHIEEEGYVVIDRNGDDDWLYNDCQYNTSEPITSTAMNATSSWPGVENWNLSNALDIEQGLDPCVHYKKRPNRERSYVIQDGCEVFGSIFKNVGEGSALGYVSNNYEPTMSSLPNGPVNDNLQQMKNKESALELSSSMFCTNVHYNQMQSTRLNLADDETDRNNQESGRKVSSILMQGQTKVGLHHTVAAVRKVVNNREKEGSILAARAFTSENPFCTVTMRRSYVSESYCLNIPKDFADKYLKDAFQGITLQLSNGGSWHTRYQVGDHRKLGSGWKEFALANHLQEDDVCIFELVDRNHIELKVFIKREIPKKFTRIFGKELSDIAVLKVPGSSKEWNVDVRKDEDCIWFQNGWHEFVIYHNISVWHLLVFRYDQNSSFGVVIFDMRASEIVYQCETTDLEEPCIETGFQTSSENENSVEDSIVESDYTKQETEARQFSSLQEEQSAKLAFEPWRPVSFEEKERVIAAANEFTSKKLFCSVTMRPSYVHEPFILSLPIAFSKHLKNGDYEVTLRGSDRQMWQVRGTGQHQFKLRKGWKEFALDNCLEEDDRCIFEIVNKKHKRLRVSIIRVLEDPKQRKRIPAHSRSPSCNPSRLVGNKGTENEYTGKKRTLTDSNQKNKMEMRNEEVHFINEKTDEVDLSNREPILSSALKFTSRTIDEENWSLNNYGKESDACSYHRKRPWECADDIETYYMNEEGCEVFGSIFRNIAYGGSSGFCSQNNSEPTMLTPPSFTLFRPIDDNLRQMENTCPLDSSSSVLHQSIQPNGRKTKKSKTNEDDSHCRKQERERRKFQVLIKQRPKALSVYRRRLVASQENERAIIEITGFTSKNPFCVVTMRPSYVHGSFTLNIPNNFAKKYLKDYFHGVTLHVPNRGAWPARFIVGGCKLCKGWKAFVVDNKLKEDDACIFELVDSDRNHIELKVSIVRFHEHSLQLAG
ncbi:B3 domain-containing protein [Thalictrum thalictroides]|uniref:B3 domain-containing protein n=1 Tax=Thalictrum thalictroides TaxID=46969 RepID=A0A7J6W0T4_THATH|nr:B3 domain-containing protein [Thalictrum thalictroides]